MKIFQRKQINTILVFWLVYFSYYLTRYNMSVAKIGIGSELNFDKEAIGLILSLFTFAYALGQSIHGFLADRLPARLILAWGIIGSLTANILISQTSVYWIIAAMWMLNGFFQSTGWPISSRAVGLKLNKNNRGIGFGVFSTGYLSGGAVALILSGFLLEKFGWRFSFAVPAILMLIPLGVNFISSETKNIHKKTATQHASKFAISVLKNRNIVFLMFAHMCLGFVRYSFINWGIEYQKETLGLSLTSSFLNLAIFPIGGIAGVIFAGFLSDKHWNSKRAVVSAAMMLFLSMLLSVFLFLPYPENTIIILLIGLIGAVVAASDGFIGGLLPLEMAHESEEGHSIGMVDAFMYIGAIGSGYINGFMIVHAGWLAAKLLWIGVSIAGAAVLFPLIKRENILTVKEPQYVESV